MVFDCVPVWIFCRYTLLQEAIQAEETEKQRTLQANKEADAAAKEKEVEEKRKITHING